MVTKSQKPNLKAKLKKAQAKIKKLEDIQKQGLEALKHMPNIRQGVYGATFVGLTYAYYHGLTHFFENFFFQFGRSRQELLDMVKDREWDFMYAAVSGPSGITLGLLGVPLEETLLAPLAGVPIVSDALTGITRQPTPGPGVVTVAMSEAVQKLHEEIQYKTGTPSLTGSPMEEQIGIGAGAGFTRELTKEDKEVINKNQRIINAWRNFEWEYRCRRTVWAMGMAGATMLFLMETSTSEVANIGAKMLDAVTPGT